MRYQISSKQFSKGDKVKIVPWMGKIYPTLANKTVIVEDVSGATAQVSYRNKKQFVDLTHLQRAIH